MNQVIAQDVESSVFEAERAYTRVLIRLGTRLAMQQQQIDDVTVEEEVETLVRRVDLRFQSDVIEHILKKHKATDKRYVIEDPILLRAKIERARVMSRTIARELEEIKERDEKEIYLIKRFLIELLDGVHRRVAERFFFDEVEESISVHFRIFCVVLLMLIIAGELTYVFLTGIVMGANATTLWFICLSLVVMQGTIRYALYVFTIRCNMKLFYHFLRYIYLEAAVYLVQFRRHVLHSYG